MRNRVCAGGLLLCALLLGRAGGRCDTPSGEEGVPGERAKAGRTDRHGNPLPPGAVLRIGSLRLRHHGPVNGVALSPDGKIVASTGYHPDWTVRLWSAATGKEIRPLPMPNGRCLPHQVAFSPDGTILAAWIKVKPPTEFERWDIRFWDARTGKVLADWEDGGGSFDFSADGKMIVSVRGLTVRFWDVAKRQPIRQFNVPGHIKSLCEVALSPDARLIACTGWRDPANPFPLGVYEVASGKEVWKALGPDPGGGRQQVAFSPDGKTVAFADEGIELYDVETGKKRGVVGRGAWTFAYSPDGSLLALASGQEISLWDVARNRRVRQFVVHDSSVTHLAFSRDGTTLVSGSRDGSIRLWDLATGKELHERPGHQYHILSLAYLPDGRSLVSHGSDHTVRLWDAATGKELRRLTLSPLNTGRDFHTHEGHHYPHSLAVSPDGRTVAICDPIRDLRLWDTATGKEKVLLKGQGVRRPTVFCTAFAPDGKAVISGDRDGTVRVWDGSTGELRKALPPSPRLLDMVFTSDGKTLVTSHSSEKPPPIFLRIRDLISGKEVGRWQVPKTPRLGVGSTLAITPDGLTLAFGAFRIGGGESESSVALWDARTETSRLLPNGHSRPIGGIAFSPDGKLLASAGEEDHTVRIWEKSTGQEVLRLLGHQHTVSTIAFSPDGRTMASGSKDTTILVWDLLRPGRAWVPQAEKDLGPLWANLASEDAATAYRAACALALAPEMAVAFLCKHLRATLEDKQRKTVRQLLADLDHEEFATREATCRELLARGWDVYPALREALDDPLSLEARSRLEGLLADLEKGKLDPESLRQGRAVQVLERIGSEKANQLLQELAEGAPWARQTRDARAALARLVSRAGEIPKLRDESSGGS